MERTFIAVKPDGVQRGLCGEIIKRFEQRGFKMVAAKFLQVTMMINAEEQTFKSQKWKKKQNKKAKFSRGGKWEGLQVSIKLKKNTPLWHYKIHDSQGLDFGSMNTK